jgi:aspartate-semialdehyde dehydrogenase
VPKQGAAIALVGGESLLAKEIGEVLEARGLSTHVKQIASAEETPGNVLLKLDDLLAAKVVLLAGTGEASRKVMELLEKQKAKPLIVDVTGALDENPAARLRAPQVEDAKPATGPIQVVGHAAAIALAIFFRQLRKAAPIRQCLVHVFEPASERGQRGLDELQQQTVGLLSFKKLNKVVYDAQVSFNLLPSFGEDAPLALETIELGIDKHLASILSSNGAGIPMPSLRVIHAPVFHGYSFSIWVEFEENPGVEAIEKALAGDRIDVRAKDQEPPSNVGVAGQSGITVGSIGVDRNEARACWFWMVADNLRISAENAVEVVSETFA